MLILFPNFPEATFIQGGTFIPDSRVVVAEPNQPLVDSCALYVGQMNAISPTSITPCSSLTLLLPLAFTCQTCIILLLVRTRVRICRSQ